MAAQFVTARQIALATGRTRQAVAKQAAAECWPVVKEKCRGGLVCQYPVADLPEDVRLALGVRALRPTGEGGEEGGDVGGDRKAGLRAELASKFAIYINGTGGGRSKHQLGDEFADLYNTGHLYPEIYQELGATSRQTLYRWLAAASSGDAATLKDRRGGRNSGETKLNSEEQKILLSFLLDQRRVRIGTAITLMRRMLGLQGKICFANLAL